jgi:hypothetical protein
MPSFSQRGRSLNRSNLDRLQGIDSDGGLVQPGGGFGAGKLDVQRNQMRRAARLPAGSVAAPSMWDGLLGAINNRARLVHASGGKFGVDLIGDPRTGEGGIGRLKAFVGDDPFSYDVPSLRALSRVAGRGR